ncbi:hypothetical protein NYQ83_16570 [Afifella sp. JA880]|uniref:hypothetical protein n=1 Tax=Afifella sp. JA880 TaxID=2975280 RepID=UPI0021BA44BD|nr:hypothetical protein [Afifella sp. JA880]MCT8268894.1 hypothetical protein [Afifella sp. JA880]
MDIKKDRKILVSVEGQTPILRKRSHAAAFAALMVAPPFAAGGRDQKPMAGHQTPHRPAEQGVNTAVNSDRCNDT